LSCLSGPQGDRGEAGSTGQKGSTGDKGSKGEMGLCGLNGSKGSAGAKGEKGAAGPSLGGVTYTRWGQSSCPSGTTSLYNGRVGTSYYNNRGGGSNFLCMPNSPEYTLGYRSGTQGYNYITAAEYQGTPTSSNQGYAATCVVCHVPTWYSVIMIPAKTSCPLF